MIKKKFTYLFVAIMVFSFANAQNTNNLLNNAANALGGNNRGNNLSNQQIVNGLKEALTIGSNNAAASASRTDGFFKNDLIRIPFPPEAREVQSRAIQLGMQQQVNDFIRSLNRAAEEASKEAAPIFANAITSMTVNDGLAILRGNDDAATRFLQNRTTPELQNRFRPIIKRAINKAQVARQWNPIITRYNRLPMVRQMNPNLEDYVLDRTLIGLFSLIASEEGKIRRDPAARVTDLLRSVFG
ncbi:MAG: DUF4197 domain-containing protein [Flavobacteriales bacterium]